MLVQDIEPRDHIVYNDCDTRTVEDIRENHNMNGCWLEFEDGSAMFHEYDTAVNVEVDLD
jgi:tRNA G26 N,N-dimethylase Trm1